MGDLIVAFPKKSILGFCHLPIKNDPLNQKMASSSAPPWSRRVNVEPFLTAIRLRNSAIANRFQFFQPIFPRKFYDAAKHLYIVSGSLSYWFGEYFLDISQGLVGRTTAAMQTKLVVYSSSNFQKNSHQIDMTE